MADKDFRRRYPDVILDTARDSRAELIVLGIRRRSPVGKIIMASTAQRVLLESPCPVLCVKAVYDCTRDFISVFEILVWSQTPAPPVPRGGPSVSAAPTCSSRS